MYHLVYDQKKIGMATSKEKEKTS